VKTAVISDIHGNWTALRAVDEALRQESPDRVVVGGDLVGNGGDPAAVIDLLGERGWSCIAGNVDELLWEPERIDALEKRLPQSATLWSILREDVRLARASIGPERLTWLRALPDRWLDDRIGVVHASPGDKWTSPASASAPDEELASVYGPLGRPIVVFGHLHVPFVRRLVALTVANSGSVGLPYDGDPRAAYLVIEGSDVSIRRVEYDVEAEIASRAAAGYPNVAWVGRLLRAAKFSPP
jgi:putative phosphoesterase